MKILRFEAVWCPACIIMRRRWQDISDQIMAEMVVFDFDQDKEAVAEYNVMGDKLPVIIFLDERGSEMERLTGEIDKGDLLEKIGNGKQ